MTISRGTRKEILAAVRDGLVSLRAPVPMRLSEHAAEHFYLSAESSYIEGAWEAFPYQVGIMDAMSNDDIRHVNWIKSARVGYTKIILAAINYFAEHKKRNQAVWQPVDDDADEFVKTEIDPMIRDIPALRAIFPYFDKKHKNNTMRQKMFAGSALHIRGGKAAKNYRRLSVDVAYIDELDGFDRDIEREGDPVTLASKRVEGATFPKVITGSTPKIAGESMVQDREDEAELSMRFKVACPHCDHMQELKWGGPDVPYGIKWIDNDPTTAAYLCEDCGATFTQDEYLTTWKDGRWEAKGGEWIDPDGFFRNDSGIIDPPLSISFHVWTAYSPMTSWTQIVREFLAARKDPGRLKTFINTTLGEPWEEEEGEKVEADHLHVRREFYECPEDVKLITFGVDTQDDRFEIQFDGWGVGEERWTLGYYRLYGDPSRGEIWERLAELLRNTSFGGQHAKLGCQDHGGHFSDEVNKFSLKMGRLFLVPVKGASIYGKPVANFPRKPNKNKVYLTEVGTDTGKELMNQRLKITDPGPGYWHFPINDQFDLEYFNQLTAEKRVPKYIKGKKTYVWDAQGRRNEPWDCSNYSLAACRVAQQHLGIRLEAVKPKEKADPADENQSRRGGRKRPGGFVKNW